MKSSEIPRLDVSSYSFYVFTLNAPAIPQIPLDFFRKKLLPEVKKGAVAVFNTSSYNTVSIPDYITGNPKLKLAFSWKEEGTRGLYPEKKFSESPHDLNKEFPDASYGTITPLEGNEKLWNILAVQGKDLASAKPWLLAHEYGKGLLVFHVGRFDNGNWAKLLSNIYDYSQKRR